LGGGPGSKPPAFVSKQHAPFSPFGTISGICRCRNKDSMRETQSINIIFELTRFPTGGKETPLYKLVAQLE